MYILVLRCPYHGSSTAVAAVAYDSNVSQPPFLAGGVPSPPPSSPNTPFLFFSDILLAPWTLASICDGVTWPLVDEALVTGDDGSRCDGEGDDGGVVLVVVDGPGMLMDDVGLSSLTCVSEVSSLSSRLIPLIKNNDHLCQVGDPMRISQQKATSCLHYT